MVLLWITAIGGLIVAIAALVVARQSARKLALITQMYWQLKYDHGELKAKVDPAQPAAQDQRQTFVPLSSIKRG